jgi:TolB-like protein/Tfp pilus assembly protein PilF
MNVARAEPVGEQGPKTEDILLQMERVLASGEFHSPERGRKFFRFVVTETLEGRSQFLKAFTIANEIFGRQTSFDAQNDPVVRIEAGRIRRGLERYYLVAGQSDAIIITIPKGGYVPHFEYAPGPRAQRRLEQGPERRDLLPSIGGHLQRKLFMAAAAVSAIVVMSVAGVYSALAPHPLSQPEGLAAQSGPIVIVDMFQSDDMAGGASDVAQGLRDEVIGQLATFDDIVVVADPSKTNYGSAMGYSLQGSVQRDGSRLRSVLRLVRRSDAAVIWANNYDSDLRVGSILQIQADVGQQIAIAVAQPYGALFMRDAAEAHRETGAYDCTAAYYSYRRAMDVQSHAAARDCLQRATRHSPQSGTAWALLSMIYLDELRFRYKLGATPEDGAADLAIYAAGRATAIAPNDSHTLQASMLVSFFNNDIDKALKTGAAAYAQKSTDAEVAGEYGLRLAMSGKWQSGCELISRALNKSAGPQGYYEVGMALCAFMRGDLQAAELWSRMCDLEYNPMHRLVLLSILGAEGKIAEATQEKNWLNTNAPEMMRNIRREVSLRLQRTEDQERFLGGLRALGIAVEPAYPQKMSSK